MTEPLDPYAWEPSSPPYRGTPFDENVRPTGDVQNVAAEYEGDVTPIPVTVVTNKPSLPQIFEWSGPVPFDTIAGHHTFAPIELVPAGRTDRAIRRFTVAATSTIAGDADQINVTTRFAIAGPGNTSPAMEPRSLLTASYYPMTADVPAWIDNDAPPVPYLLHAGDAVYFDVSWFIRTLADAPDVVFYVRAEVS